jgi:hypothetical protein
MSLYRNGNVFTARFLVTGNCCILFDPGQLSKHDQDLVAEFDEAKVSLPHQGTLLVQL